MCMCMCFHFLSIFTHSYNRSLRNEIEAERRAQEAILRDLRMGINSNLNTEAYTGNKASIPAKAGAAGSGGVRKSQMDMH